MTPEQYDAGIYKRFDQERQTEKFYEELIKEGKEVAKKRFTTLDEAQDYSFEYANRTIEDINKISASAKVVVKLDGPCVLVPNISVNKSNNAVTIRYDEATPFISKPPLNDRYGVPRSISAPVLGHEDETYSIMPIVIFEDTQPIQTDLISNKGDLGHIKSSLYLYVHCDGSAEISIPALDQLRITTASIGQLAVSCSAEVALNAQTIANALYSEDPREYTPLRRIDLLASIANTTIEESSSALVVADTMLDVFGKNRTLIIEGDVYSKPSDAPDVRKVKGSILGVLSYDPQSRTDQPTIVLESSANDEKTMYYAPFTSIKTLSF